MKSRRSGIGQRGFKFYLVMAIVVLILGIFVFSSLNKIPSVKVLRGIFIVDKLTFFIILIMTIFSFVLIKELFDIYILKKNIGQRGRMLKKSSSDE